MGMDKTKTIAIRDLVEGNTTYTQDEETDVEVYYEPFIEDGKVGFHVRDHHGREQTIYLEPCTNETLVWVHMNDLDDEERSPECFFTIAKDWPAEGWQVTVNGQPVGEVFDHPDKAMEYEDEVRKAHTSEHTIDIVSAPKEKE